MPLTDSERKSFTLAKLVELDRAPNRVDNLLDPPNSTDIIKTPEQIAELRAKVHGQLAAMTVPQLRMRLNIESFGNQMVYSPDNNYTAEEQNAIKWGYKSNVGRKPIDEIPAILAHVQEMKADGLSPAIIKAILKSR